MLSPCVRAAGSWTFSAAAEAGCVRSSAAAGASGWESRSRCERARLSAGRGISAGAAAASEEHDVTAARGGGAGPGNSGFDQTAALDQWNSSQRRESHGQLFLHTHPARSTHGCLLLSSAAVPPLNSHWHRPHRTSAHPHLPSSALSFAFFLRPLLLTPPCRPPMRSRRRRLRTRRIAAAASESRTPQTERSRRRTQTRTRRLKRHYA